MTLDDLIKRVNRDAGSDEPLDKLSAAMGVKVEIDEMTDSLIGHFVDQARRAGCSWSDIGAAMGVSKQAAQQRHTGERAPRRGGGMFTRFTGRARTAVQVAGTEAGELGHTYIGTEHLLLGILADEEALGTKALATLGLTRAQVLAGIEGAEPEQDVRGGRRRRHLPFTPLAKKVMELSLREALTLGHNYVGTEHLVLALHREKSGLAGKIMRANGIERDALAAEITKRLAAA